MVVQIYGHKTKKNIVLTEGGDIVLTGMRDTMGLFEFYIILYSMNANKQFS